MVDPLERLPVELHFAILKSLPDLSSLYCLICASRSARSTFEEHPVEIAGSIISFLTLELRQVMCAVCLSQTGHVRDSLLDGALYANQEKGMQVDTDEKFGNPLPSKLPLSAIQNLVQTSRNIDIIAKYFLDTYIDRLNNIEAEHPAQEVYFFRGRVFDDYPKGRIYDIKKTGSTSWVERYRVVCALWRIQLLLDSRAQDYILGSPENMTLMESETPIERRYALILTLITSWEIDEMKCVMDFLSKRKHLQAAMTTGQDRTSKDVLPAGLSTSLNITGEDLPLSYPPTDEVSCIWGQDRQAAKHANIPHRWFRCYGSTSPSSPLQGTDWLIYRRLGFGILDRKRMCVMELLGKPQKNDPDHPLLQLIAGVGTSMNPSGIAFTWRSIRFNREKVIDQIP